MFLNLGRRQSVRGLVGFACDAEGLSIVHIIRDKAQGPRLESCQFIPCTDETARIAAATQAVQTLKLEHLDATAVMDASGYQLLLVEAPDVQPDELRGAIRWRIKDLIDFHIDDAVIDVFEVPGQHSTGAGGRLMYAVAARNQAVQDSIHRLARSGVELKSINIPEMCLRNIAALLPEDASGVASLYLAHDHGRIVLTRQGTLYLTRQIDIGYAALEKADETEFEQLAGEIVLELQRSLDYYDRHYIQNSIANIAILPTAIPLPRLAAYINDNLGARVIDCDINQLITLREPVEPALLGRCLPALGAALREEAKAL